MLPGYAGVTGSPLLAEALLSNRDGLVRDLSSVPRSELQGAWPAVGEALQLRRWSAEVRINLCLSELLRQAQFEVKGKTATLSAGKSPLVSMTQPARDVFTAPGGQFDKVFYWATGLHRSDRAAEIVTQVVPPVSFLSAVADLSPERHRHTFELLEVGLRFAFAVAMRFKDALNVPRPIAHSPLLQPMLLTPGHASLPSGHATEAFMAAMLLIALQSAPASRCEQLRRLAFRIAENRVVAGLHFPVDSIAGQALGETLASWFIALAGEQDTDIASVKFDLTHSLRGAEPTLDFPGPDQGCRRGKAVKVKAGGLSALPALFKMAQAEWA